ncbi:hypothetical protein [Methanothrix sp.]|uniref:hypothetical protein n=1 Tax=Methanothrix sp. TaxID=90426 RepID=UPI001BD38C30
MKNMNLGQNRYSRTSETMMNISCSDAGTYPPSCADLPESPAAPVSFAFIS